MAGVRAGAAIAAGGGGALALVATGQVWLVGTVVGTVRELPGGDAVAVTGREVLPVAVALALIGCAGGVVLATAGRVIRTVAALALVPSGLGLAVGALMATRGPAAALQPAAGRLGGTTSAVVAGAHTTAWPWLAAIAGAAITGAGLVALIRGRTWAGTSDRSDRAAAAAGRRPDAVEAWEALDRGEDPTTRSDARSEPRGGGE